MPGTRADYYFGAVTEGISVTMLMPTGMQHHFKPAGGSEDVEFFIFNNILTISLLTPSIRSPSSQSNGRHLLAKLKNANTYWGVEANVDSTIDARLAVHMQQAKAVSAAIDMLRPCAGWKEFQERTLLVKQNWDIPLAALEAKQLNAISSFASCPMDPEELYNAARTLSNGKKVVVAHFLELIVRSGLWYLITPDDNAVLGTMVQTVGEDGITMLDGTPVWHPRLAGIAEQLSIRL